MLWFIETCKHVWKQKLSLYIYFQDNSEKLQEAEYKEMTSGFRAGVSSDRYNNQKQTIEISEL